MAAFTLAPNSTWFKKGNTTVTRASITEIHILNTTYQPTSEYISWDASEDNDGSVMCYIEGSELIIARGNGTGLIYANSDSSYLFSAAKDDTATDGKRYYFSNVVVINGLQNLDVSKAETFKCLCYEMARLTSFTGVYDWDVSNVTVMSHAWRYCTSLTSLAELDGWKDKTGNVIQINSMFSGHNNDGDMVLTEVGIENWDVSNVVCAGFVFYGCGALKSLDLNNWNTSKFWSIDHVFADCRELVDLYVSKWDVSNVEDFDAAFNECKSVKILDLSGWRTSSARDFRQLFDGCNSLEEIIGLENFDTSAIDSYSNFYDPITGDAQRTELPYRVFYETFYNCQKLKTLDLSWVDNSKAEGYQWMFKGCTELETIYVSDLWRNIGVEYNPEWDELMFDGCPRLTGEEGTTFASAASDDAANSTRAVYARVDGADGLPGYFTHINNKPGNKVVVESKSLYDAAKTLRKKLSTTEKFIPSEIDSAIERLPSLPSGDPVAQIGDKTYISVADALAEAKSGDTVTMIADSTEGDLVIPSGVTLNIASYNLTADTVTGLDDGNIDADAPSATARGGWLTVDKDNLRLHSVYRLVKVGTSYETFKIPAWIDDHYVFSAAQITTFSTEVVDENTLKLKFRVNFSAYLKKGEFSTGTIKNGIRVIATYGEEDVYSYQYPYSDEAVADILNKPSEYKHSFEVPYKNGTFARPKIVADCGVEGYFDYTIENAPA